MALTIDVSASADANPYTLPTGWTYVKNNFKIVSNALRSSTDISIALVNSPPSSGVMSVTWVTALSSAGFSDTSGAVFATPSPVDGYYACLEANRLSVYVLTAGAIGTRIAQSSALTFAVGDTFEARYDLATNILTTYQNSVSTTIPVTTSAGLTAGAGFSDGCAVYEGNNNSAGIKVVTASAGASATLDTLTSPVSVGGTGYTGGTTTLGTATTLTFAGKSASITGTSSNEFTFSMPAFSNGVTYPAMGSQTFTVGDGTLTATKASTVQAMAGYTAVTMSTMNTGTWSIGKDPAIVSGSVIHAPTAAGTLNNDGTLTDYVFGTYTCWMRDQSDGKMYSFALTVTNSGIVINDLKISTRGISKAHISKRSITS